MLFYNIPGKKSVLIESLASIRLYSTTYWSKGRPPKSDDGTIFNSIVFELGFISDIWTCPGGFARRRFRKCFSIRELSARHSNFESKSSPDGLY